jgi:hypothetical protein
MWNLTEEGTLKTAGMVRLQSLRPSESQGKLEIGVSGIAKTELHQTRLDRNRVLTCNPSVIGQAWPDSRIGIGVCGLEFV